jgi:hypothetical protein
MVDVFDLLKSTVVSLFDGKGKSLADYELRLGGKTVINSTKLGDICSDTPFELVKSDGSFVHHSAADVVLMLQRKARKPNFDGIIAASGIKIPFVERQEVLDTLMKRLNNEANLSSEERVDKNHHRIPVLATISGFGKTRTLLQLKQILETDSTAQRVWKHIYITYGQGYSETEWERLSNSMETLFAWRILYFYFSPDLVWSSFVAKIRRIDGAVWPTHFLLLMRTFVASIRSTARQVL